MSPDRENQIFLTYRGDIFGRFDPNYIKKISYINNINTRYPLVSLGSLLAEPPMYGANEIAVDGDPQIDVRYIRITDIDDHGNLRDEDWKTVEKVDEKYALDRNDLLFARSGATAGKAFIHKREDSEAIFAGYLIRFRFDETRINPFFVFYYTLLSRYRFWVQVIQRPSGQPNINSKEFKAFEIPLPPPNIQNHIVTIIRAAYDQKKRKEQEADVLLDSIDDYVLKELGIEMPAVEERKYFRVYAGETTGRRIDPRFHQSKHREVIHMLESGKYSIMPLSSLITDLKNGVEIRTYSNHGYRYLRVSDLGKNGIENHDPRYVDVKEIPDRVRLTNNSFLISRSGSLGLVSVIEDKIRNTVLGSDIFKVELDTESIQPRYLEAFFRSRIGQTLIFQLNSGSIIPRLDQPAVKSLRVVVPPFEVQEKIAEEAVRRQSQAAKLRQEANAIVEQAKERVERILLSEA